MKGAREMVAKIQAIAKKFPDHVGQGMYQESQPIMGKAKKYCPVAPDGGTLRSTGTVHEPEVSGKRISIEMSFGGASIDYAVAVHEHLSAHSPASWVAAEASGHGINWSTPGTGPKFLERAINEARPSFASKLARRIHFNQMRGV